MSDRQSFGKHWLRLEPEGVVFLKYYGTLTTAEMQQVVAIMEPVLKQGCEIYMIFDVSEASNIEPGARKLGLQWLTDMRLAGAVNFGGSMLSRAAAEMIASAARLMHKIEVAVAFVKTEADARTWVSERRVRRTKKP